MEKIEINIHKFIEDEVKAYIEDLKRSKRNIKKIAIRKIILDRDGSLKEKWKDQITFKVMSNYYKELQKGNEIDSLSKKGYIVKMIDGKFYLIKK